MSVRKQPDSTNATPPSIAKVTRSLNDVLSVSVCASEIGAATVRRGGVKNEQTGPTGPAKTIFKPKSGGNGGKVVLEVPTPRCVSNSPPCLATANLQTCQKRKRL